MLRIASFTKLGAGVVGVGLLAGGFLLALMGIPH
jgi:hypothetical protein